ncbi:hypothetical protein TRVL_09672 [Trypanosoma vivax]|nr:hypothetical protein TRVL_09672 [Trypanosoma vivax]
MVRRLHVGSLITNVVSIVGLTNAHGFVFHRNGHFPVLLLHVRRISILDEKSRNRKRHSAENTRGRSEHVYNIIDKLKSISKSDVCDAFEKLHPRNKVNILRALKRRRLRQICRLSTYRSQLFERSYFFREEDLWEASTLGRGPGGQATNRRMQTAIVKHVPTGIVVKFSKFPSYWRNRKAARHLLNLKLEEHLLGSKSRLGRLRQRREQKRVRRQHIVRRLVERSIVASAKCSQLRLFHAVLTNQKPLPPVAIMQLGPMYYRRTLFVSDMFESECGNWWAMLCGAFASLVKDGANDHGSKAVPELLRHMFPSVDLSAECMTSAQQHEWKELVKCSTDEKAIGNVRRALECFVELFGLQLCETPLMVPSNGHRLSLVRDGQNWLELRGRMIASRERMTPFSISLFSHVVLSLTQLRCTKEADALVLFFLREATSRTGGQWAVEGQRVLSKVVADQNLRTQRHFSVPSAVT